ncbi:hypothetical protein ACWEQ2_37555 [Streptomyces sp. NPDC004096]
MQVYARDVPWFDGFPKDADVLQILWCPFQHYYEHATVPYNGTPAPSFTSVTAAAATFPAAFRRHRSLLPSGSPATRRHRV